MTALNELYQEMILDHNRRPRNFQKLEKANRSAEGYNPLCGDQITIYLRLDPTSQTLQEVSFLGSGCAISKASCSMMTEALRGKNRSEADLLFEKFHQMVTGEPHCPVPPELGKLAVFSGVCEYPSRVKCATLAWHTMKSALEGKGEAVSTEQEEKKQDAQPTLKDQVIEVLQSCYDPEIPVNIYELGLIYDITVGPANDISIRMTLTSPACPVAGSLPPEVEAKVKQIAGVGPVKVEVVWEPPWSPEKMSEAARLQLGMM